MASDTKKIYTVAGPDRDKEAVVPYYEYAATFLGKLFGRNPSRNTLIKYLHMDTGYPVKRHGPYIKLPVFTELKRQFTTVEAMRRFAEKLDEVQREIGVIDARIDQLPKKKGKK